MEESDSIEISSMLENSSFFSDSDADDIESNHELHLEELENDESSIIQQYAGNPDALAQILFEASFQNKVNIVRQFIFLTQIRGDELNLDDGIDGDDEKNVDYCPSMCVYWIEPNTGRDAIFYASAGGSCESLEVLLQSYLQSQSFKRKLNDRYISNQSNYETNQEQVYDEGISDDCDRNTDKSCIGNIKESGPCSPEDRRNTCGTSPLFIASAMNHPKIITILIELGYNDSESLYLTNDFGSTALLVATELGNTSVVEKLLDYEKPSTKYSLLPRNQPNDLGNTPLLAACKHGYVDIVRLLSHSPRSDLPQSQPPIYKTDFRVRDNNSYDCVMKAVIHNQPSIILFLSKLITDHQQQLDTEILPNMNQRIFPNKETSLHLSVNPSSDGSCFVALLESPHVDYKAMDKENRTVLHKAVEINANSFLIKVFRSIISSSSQHISSSASLSLQRLIQLANIPSSPLSSHPQSKLEPPQSHESSGASSKSRTFTSAGKKSPSQGMLPLHVALALEQESIVHLLAPITDCNAYADIPFPFQSEQNTRHSVKKKRPIFMAVEQNNVNILRALLLSNNDSDDCKSYTCGNLNSMISSIVTSLKKIRTIDSMKLKNKTCEKSDRIEGNYKNIDVNAFNEDGHTALIVAASLGYIEICKVLLIEGKADVNIKSQKGSQTALQKARKRKLDSVVKLLKDFGAT